MEIVNRIKEISKSQPICPSCNGLNSDCFDCHGIGHIFNEALTKAYEEFLQYRSERTLIYTDYMALYGNDSISINKIALSPLFCQIMRIMCRQKLKLFVIESEI